MYIYIIENKLNGKIYVGQTTQENPLKRWLWHKQDSSRKYSKIRSPVDRAIKWFGKENFVFMPIEYHSTQNELNQAEVYWIDRVKSFVGQKGIYNVNEGGSSGKMSSDVKRKISKNSARHWLGKKFSDKHRQNMSIGLSGIGINKDGRPHSEEVKQRLSKANTGKKHSEETKVKMSNSHKHTLSTTDDIDIINDYSTGKYTHRSLAKKYGVGKTIIGYILRGRKYRKHKR